MTRTSDNLGAVVSGAPEPAKIAVIDFDGERAREISYRQLDALAAGVARALRARGLGQGQRVAILAANSSDHLAVHFGTMRAGLVSVPVNHRLPADTVRQIIGDAGAEIVFCDRERRAMVPPDVTAIDLDAPGGLGAFVDPGPFEPVEVTAGDPAIILYTSGSTGRPKGVVMSHGGLRWVVDTRLAGAPIAAERFLIAAPLYHLNALALAHLVFAGRGTMVLMPQFKVRPYIAAIARFRCTWLTSVPPMIAMMLEDREAVAGSDFSSVRSLRMGSAPVSPSLYGKIREQFPQARIVNAYGTTEGSPVVFGPHPDGRPTPSDSLGCSHPAVALRLVDDAGLAGEAGMLHIRSPGLMTGYHNRPDLAPFTADGYYATGDLFRRDGDGFYYFLGRADDMFVSGGENIFPGEVEGLLEAHPDVVQACVVPIDDPIKGQKPVAFVRLNTGSRIDAEALKAFALARGPAYQHPRVIWFLDDFPLASTNKIDRAVLKMRARQLAQRENASREDVLS